MMAGPPDEARPTRAAARGEGAAARGDPALGAASNVTPSPPKTCPRFLRAGSAMRNEEGPAAARHEQEHAESYPTAFDEAVARRNGLIFPITEEPPLSRAPSQEGDHARQGGIAGGQKQRDAGREAGSGARQDVGVEQSAKPVASVLLAGAAAREGFFPGQSGVGWGVGMHIPGSGASPAHAQQSAQRGVAGGQTRYWQMQEELRQRCVAFALVLQCQACVQSKGF